MINLVPLWTNIARAYEIALLGNFSITVVFDEDYVQGFEDYETIKSFYKNVLFTKNGDLTVQIYKPDDYLLNGDKYETLDDIIERVDKAKHNKRPNKFKDDSCNILLKTAIDKFSFSFSKTESIIEISKVIAQLDNSNYIEPQHVAEAIQYNIVKNKFYYAEDKSIFLNKNG